MIPDNPLLDYFNQANDFLNINYQLQEEQDERDLEQFKRDYNLDRLADELDTGQVPDQLEFYFGGQNESFFSRLLSLAPTPSNANFLDFLASDFGAEIMRQNLLSIHTASGNLYYNNLNTGESIYEFILAQQNETKQIVNAKLHYGGSFQEYLRGYLAGINANIDARVDTLKNKNIKYLFYRYNDFVLSRGLGLSQIRHSQVSADEIVMEELQNRNWQYLIESLIYKVEKDRDCYKVKTKQDSEMIRSMEKKNYKNIKKSPRQHLYNNS